MFHYCERTVVMSLRLQWPDRFIYRCYGPECVCHLIKDKAAEFSNLEWPAHEMLKKKILHSLRCCFDDHWADNNFVVLKVDMTNA